MAEYRLYGSAEDRFTYNMNYKAIVESLLDEGYDTDDVTFTVAEFRNKLISIEGSVALIDNWKSHFRLTSSSFSNDGMRHLLFPNRNNNATRIEDVYPTDRYIPINNIDPDGYESTTLHKFTHSIEDDTVRIEYKHKNIPNFGGIPYNYNQMRIELFSIVGTDYVDGVTYPRYELWDCTLARDYDTAALQLSDNKNTIIHRHSVLKTTEQLIDEYLDNRPTSNRNDNDEYIGSTLAFLKYNRSFTAKQTLRSPVVVNPYGSLSAQAQRNLHLHSSIVNNISRDNMYKKTATSIADNKIFGNFNQERGFLVNR